MVAAGRSMDRPLGSLERYMIKPLEVLAKMLDVTGRAHLGFVLVSYSAK